jgi:acyl-CoA synthetase (NDP forming)
MLIDQPLPAGNRMAIVGNAGGLTALAAGTARAYGFDIVRLTCATRAELPTGHGDNPVDLGVDALPARIADAAETVAHSGEADVLVLILVGTRANVLAATMSALAPVVDDQPRLTVAAVVTGDTGDIHELGRRGAPVFREPEQALRALAHARDYATWRREPQDRRPDLGGPHPGAGRHPVRRAPAAPPGRVDRRLTAEILSAYGLDLLTAVPAQATADPTLRPGPRGTG